ncbi:MAG: phosphatase PAP2 family protein [Proteobacteria bacterium]|nr:phosphatase PAP2 family protein [Pseudomonadota bacterium]
MKRFSAVIRIWLLWLVACAAAVAISFAELDIRVARHFWDVGRHLSALNTAFGAAVLLTLESAVVLVLILARVTRGHLSRLGETLGVACLASICAYGINDQVLKPLFGVQPPAAVLHGARHVFFAVSSGSLGFPSGHMVLAGSFAGVFMRLYRASLWPLAALLLIAAILLIVGDWHFVSDVIAGSFLGISAGFLAGEGWLIHMYER